LGFLKINIGLSKRIYLAMLSIIVMSSLAIAVFTVFFFKNQNEEYHLSRLKRKESRIAKSIQYFLNKNNVAANLNEVPRIFYEKIEELSDVNNIDINIFDIEGNILFAFSKSNTIVQELSPEVIEILQKQKFDVYIEDISEKNLSTYSIIKNVENKNVGILNIPYHDFSKSSIEFNEFYKTLIEVYFFLLIGASILAYFLSKNITKSLRTIGENMKNVSFGKKNDKLIWKNKDEVGELVEYYNNMIDQLEESATLLAQSERESAWREMAKQVAHEIKNPLTPMKLNVQYLEQTLRASDENFKEKMGKFSEKMITQIDALTNIANEFSNFAKMPSTSLQAIDLLRVLKISQETFENEIKVVFNTELSEANIEGDEDQLIRIFNNLFKNACQAIDTDVVGVIIISLTQNETEYLVEIKDNGKGIDPSQYDKIFVPNFTTKSSGTGIGLAMVHNMIKNHHGKVWFESKLEKGTSFYLSFPKTTD
jgi:nitrogen fixation/metabolism regulation signal transduction histidine kinase